MTLTPGTSEFTSYIQARDDNTCQLNHSGCTRTCDQVTQRLSDEDLEAMRRDPNSPDNWCCACTACATEEGS